MPGLKEPGLTLLGAEWQGRGCARSKVSRTQLEQLPPHALPLTRPLLPSLPALVSSCLDSAPGDS